MAEENKYTEDYKHFDRMIWQVPTWSSALFIVSLAGTGKLSELASTLSRHDTQIVEVDLLRIYLAIVGFVMLSLWHTLYRFRTHQSNLPKLKSLPTTLYLLSAQFLLQLVIAIQMFAIAELFLLSFGCDVSCSLTICILSLVLVTCCRELGIWHTRRQADECHP